jgi:hypothetical protein
MRRSKIDAGSKTKHLHDEGELAVFQHKVHWPPPLYPGPAQTNDLIPHSDDTTMASNRGK